jgi:hypothetical protein
MGPAGPRIPNVATKRQFLIRLSMIGWGTVRQIKASVLLPMGTTISPELFRVPRSL